MLVLLAGIGVTLAGVVAGSAVLLLAGSAIAGLGWGACVAGAFRSLVALGTPEDRAGMVVSIFAVSYVAMSVPAIAAGLAVGRWGLHDASIGYAVFVAFLVALATIDALMRRGAGTQLHPRPLPAPPCCAPGATT